METDFDIYLKKYCGKHQISPEEAIQHALVKLVKKYYEEEGE